MSRAKQASNGSASSAAAAASQVLPPKDAANFRTAVKFYENKQYKKALKSADLVLKKNPENGETLALKGLAMYFMEQKEEGGEYVTKGVTKNPSSYFVWHINGIYQRIEKKYEEAAKSYAKALTIDPKNDNLLRDLAPLQMQTRQFTHLVTTRKKMVVNEKMAGFRMNWTGLAVAQYMAGDYASAESTLKQFMSLVKVPFPRTDTENAEVALFENLCIYKSGDVQRALDHLDSIADNMLDRLAVREQRALYLFELGKLKEAEREYRALIRRNPENAVYYEKLEQVLGIDPKNERLREVLYAKLATKYPKSDLPLALPLHFLTGAAFKKHVGKYISEKLARGVPSTFIMVKPLYKDAEKRKAIHEFVTEYYNTLQDGDPATWVWSTYYMAQHHAHIGEIDTALKYINAAIEHTPTLVELYTTKANIVKHTGDVAKACDLMNEARLLDLQDRFVNTKAVKYMLRAGRMEEAIDTLSLFTRNDSTGKGVQDLHDMQGVWFLNEQAESYARLGDKGLALKRFLATCKAYDEFFNDQYDFHFYCPRKGTVRTYLDLISWEDKVYGSPGYLRAVRGAASILFDLAERLNHPEDDEFAGMDEAEKKKLLKKQKKERVKQLKKEQDDKNKTDTDPLGKKLLESKTPVQDLEKIWKLTGENGTRETFEIGFEIYLREKKHVLAVGMLQKAKAAGSSQSWVRSACIRERYVVNKDESIPDALKALPLKVVSDLSPEGDILKDDLNQYAERVIVADEPASYIDYINAVATINETLPETAIAKAASILQNPNVHFTNAVELYNTFKTLRQHAAAADLKSAASEKWPQVSYFI